MKKLFSLFISVLMIICCLANVCFAADISTSYRYDSRFNAALFLYNDLALLSESYYALPGLENTVLADGESCNCMTPQGLCVTEDYILVSAYCGIKRYKADLEENVKYGKNAEKLSSEENHKVHNSVIYVLDKETGAYLKTIVLPDSNHVGGLATDGRNIFVAKSNDKQVSIITQAQLSLIMAMNSTDVVSLGFYQYSFDCDCTASFVTYYNDILWVGVFNEKEEGELNGFSFNLITGLEKVSSVKIPEKANGASFTEIDGEICLNVNTSYGRKNASEIYLYSVEGYGSDEIKITEKDKYTVPPTVQNSVIYEGKVYHIYEAAATCYSQVESFFDMKSTSTPVDRICIADAENLFNWHNDNIFFERVTAFVRAVKTIADSII